MINTSGNVITAAELKTEILRRRYLSLLSKNDVFPSQKNWDYIIASRMQGLGGLLYHKYLVSLNTDIKDRVECHHCAIKNFPKYFDGLCYEEACSAIYSNLSSSGLEESIRFAEKYNLFDARRLLVLLESGHIDVVMKFLPLFKVEYDAGDLISMKMLLRKLRNLPELGCKSMVKGVFSSQMRYICPVGHVNPDDFDFCNTPGCGRNIFGLTKDDLAVIDAYENLIDVLEDMIRKGQA